MIGTVSITAAQADVGPNDDVFNLSSSRYSINVYMDDHCSVNRRVTARGTGRAGSSYKVNAYSRYQRNSSSTWSAMQPPNRCVNGGSGAVDLYVKNYSNA